MRALKDENRRLKRIVADQALHIDTLTIAAGKLLTPAQKRRVVQIARNSSTSVNAKRAGICKRIAG